MEKNISKTYFEIADLVESLQKEPKEIQNSFHKHLMEMLSKEPDVLSDPYKHLKAYKTIYDTCQNEYKLKHKDWNIYKK